MGIADCAHCWQQHLRLELMSPPKARNAHRGTRARGSTAAAQHTHDTAQLAHARRLLQASQDAAQRPVPEAQPLQQGMLSKYELALMACVIAEFRNALWFEVAQVPEFCRCLHSAGAVRTLNERSTQQQSEWTARGMQLVRAGHVAALLLAGGQGTRLGSIEPKVRAVNGTNEVAFV